MSIYVEQSRGIGDRAYSSEVEVVKDLAAVPPDVGIPVLLLTFVYIDEAVPTMGMKRWTSLSATASLAHQQEANSAWCHLTVEAVDLCNLSRFVIAANERYPVGISGAGRQTKDASVGRVSAHRGVALALRAGIGLSARSACTSP